MPSASIDRSSRVRVWVALCTLAAAVCAVVGLLGMSPDSAGAVRSAPPALDAPDPDLIEISTRPLNVQATLPASDHDISPSESVIGVTVGGMHRAYTLEALGGVTQHVVNDLLAGRPVTVTYCPRTGCTRVFTAAGGERLRLVVGGLLNKKGAEQMVLRDGRERFQQETGNSLSGGSPIPYPTLDYQLTTWGEWRESHPDSDLYAGGAGYGY